MSHQVLCCTRTLQQCCCTLMHPAARLCQTQLWASWQERTLVFTPASKPFVSMQQDRGILRIHCHRGHHVLLTSSWDNVARLYDTRDAADPICIHSESGAAFTGLAYDAEAQQVRASPGHGPVP